MNENQIGKQVVDAGFQVHSNLGPGLLESVYKVALKHEIQSRGLFVAAEFAIPIQYKDIEFNEGFRADLIIEKKVIIELKSVEDIHPVHHKQLLTYLKLSGCRLGYLMNFGADLFKNGITRMVNGMESDFEGYGVREASFEYNLNCVARRIKAMKIYRIQASRLSGSARQLNDHNIHTKRDNLEILN